ncbi:winged helix-turn-helix domain-containing protein [Psychroserpens sp. MEBiC05023]
MEKQHFYLICSAFTLLIMIGFISCSSNADDDSGIIKIALREAGNQLLLKQKDSTSIILPIIEKEQGHYQLSFQNVLAFEPNELVTVIDSSFHRASIASNYRVEVTQCFDDEVAYSYEMNVEEERTIIPCAGRYLPEACYIVTVSFLNPKSNVLSRHPLAIIAAIGFMFFIIYYFKEKAKVELSEEKNTSYSEIGSFQFYPEQNKLVKAATEINLSKKECELLELFVASPNQVIKRDELTKKVWEDNGVIVGRSLDTYISKLRKKLKEDDSIKLTNVHGVGYKLEVN